MNNIIIKGRLTADPELKKTQNDVSVSSFTVAVNRTYSKDENTDFFNCTAWRSNAEFITKYFTKGQEILLQGEMQSRKYEDKEGNNRIAWEIIVNHAEFCGSKQTAEKPNLDIVTDDDDDDLPWG